MFQKGSIATICIWKGRAYIPVEAKYDLGMYVDVDPVYVTPIDLEEIVKAVQAVRDAGNIIIPRPKNREEFLQRKDPILVATHARSWKELAKTGASYTIDWAAHEVRIDMSRLDKKGRWEYDPEKVKKLPPDTPLEHIVEIILEDIKTRPELFGEQ